MLNSYQVRFQSSHTLIHSEQIKQIARFPENNTFTRTRKLPLNDIIVSTLAKKGLQSRSYGTIFFRKTNYQKSIGK